MAELIGIAVHQQSRGAIQKLTQAQLNPHNGLGDYRGAKNPRTSVTLLSLHSWQAALAETDDFFAQEIDWIERRANLLIDAIEFSNAMIGRRLQIGEAILQITCETDPCSRMDSIAQGLKKALTPNWRGGARCQVIHAGKIECGEQVQWLD
ncbi:molybdenum cofactor biosynthesis protein [Thiosulfatimonas sediminis]|uniref:Molybdenum cofactor biosynthesis protein n=1 Tax=Thiosulfatimonas sediminis TaxID=2675054 RepID=A0A6F8PUR3_9GAMM|nr:MOSC domain-containing protein [Thiosulfatimonas sediminis]BBP45836.1 molybdenum cofactor biosynthesis protein [Thiosulfatimonas sediminis]